MKEFETPEIQIVVFNVEDIITTSGATGGNGTLTPDDEL